jgi:L-threonylcarbamoyladenylate synthase
VSALRDCSDPALWWPHVDEAARALAAGGLVVLPTDTVYGIAADAFQPEAVQALLDAKGRGRHMPPPVLVGDVRTMDGLADAIPDRVRELVTQHWPGPLTVILQAQPSLQWDLGETNGTVALRMPDHELALAVLRKTGPLAVSSANASGSPAATTAAAAEEMLGTSVRVYLDAGDSPGGVASTIIDATGGELRIVREGALSAAELGIAVAEPQDEPVADEPVADEPIADEPAADEVRPEPETVAPVASTPARPAAGSVPDDVVIAPRRVRRPTTDAVAEQPDEPEAPGT